MSEALRLADELDTEATNMDMGRKPIPCTKRKAAAELRRLAGVEEELAALKAAMGEPVATLTMFDIRSQTGTVDLCGGWKELRVGDQLYTHPAPQKG